MPTPEAQAIVTLTCIERAQTCGYDDECTSDGDCDSSQTCDLDRCECDGSDENLVDSCEASEGVAAEYFAGALEWVEVAAANTFTGSDGVSQVTSRSSTDIICQAAGLDIPETDIIDAAETCGPLADGDGLVACHPNSQTALDAAGDHMVVALGVDADIPLNDPSNLYQFGFVFDTDGESANDWEPYPAYPMDFFADTDLWFQLLYEPGSGWILDVADIGPGNQILPRPSSNARAVIRQSAVVFMVPMSELGSGPLAMRTSTFRHQGNFLADDWNGDAHPFVGNGLRDLQ